tara:strand:+ start:188 stop:406 length:219 start_codon:yes stop_codon:yes gene_type:complete
MRDETIYHIYAKDRCLYPALNEEEFEVRWAELKAMVGLMKTDYREEDLSFERLPGNSGGYENAYDDNLEPSY